jgi:hypothetical protein
MKGGLTDGVGTQRRYAASNTPVKRAANRMHDPQLLNDDSEYHAASFILAGQNNILRQFAKPVAAFARPLENARLS